MIRFSLALLACAAFAQDVSYNFEPNTDFSKYKTYRWMEHPKSADIDDITKGQLARAFEPVLATKGLTLKQSGDTDLVITYQLAVQQEKEMTTMDTGGWGYGPGWRGGWYGGGGGIATTTTNTINIGTIVLDMYDTSNKHLVWRGAASKTVDPDAKPDKRQKNMSKAANKMLKNYPPKEKKS